MNRAEIRAALAKVFFFRATYAFALSYLLVNLLFVWALQKSPSQAALWVFLTSPLNFIENQSQLYHSFTEGLNLNYVFVGIEIMVAESYTKLVQTRLKSFFTAYKAFGYAILASYILSILTWWHNGFPSSGTSIIGFCTLAYLFVVTVFDFAYVRGRLRKEGRLQAFMKFVLWFCCLILSPIFALTYVIGNPSALLHLSGLTIFVVLAIGGHQHWETTPAVPKPPLSN